jgi:hypothetical protein
MKLIPANPQSGRGRRQRLSIESSVANDETVEGQTRSAFRPLMELQDVVEQIGEKMRMTIAVRGIVLLGLFLISGSLFGQKSNPSSEVFVGFSPSRQGDISINGWTVSGAVFVNEYIGIVGDFSDHRRGVGAGVFNGGVSVFAYRFGPRVTFRSDGPVTPFAQVLFGGARLGVNAGFDTGTSVYSESAGVRGSAVAFGGGIDFDVSRRYALRAQLDRSVWRFNQEQSNGFRSAFGLVIRFGGNE